MNTLPAPGDGLDDARAWPAIRAAARIARASAPRGESAFRPDSRRGLSACDPGAQDVWVVWRGDRGWSVAAAAPEPARRALELYLPLCAPDRDRARVIAHLGQSVDGFIANPSGDSYYVTGPENLTHLHRLRALCDAVVVGAGTVAADDPRLTTRRVPGPDPARVILDPDARLPATHRVFADGGRTYAVHRQSPRRAGVSLPNTVRRMEIPCRDGTLDLRALLCALHARGLRRVLVEGGGDTVSRFLGADLLDRLQIAIAPLIIGAGRPGVRIAPAARLADSLRPAHRTFRLGEDVLFDFDLRAAARTDVSAGS